MVSAHAKNDILFFSGECRNIGCILHKMRHWLHTDATTAPHKHMKLRSDKYGELVHVGSRKKKFQRGSCNKRKTTETRFKGSKRNTDLIREFGTTVGKGKLILSKL